jgi:hypothetical protein
MQMMGAAYPILLAAMPPGPNPQMFPERMLLWLAKEKLQFALVHMNNVDGSTFTLERAWQPA